MATGIPGRTGKQCRERWTNRLDPALNHEMWTPQEDATLLYQQKAKGNCWSKITTFLPHRSANALKNRWCWLARHSDTGPPRTISAPPAASADRPESPPVRICAWSDTFDLSGMLEWLYGHSSDSAMEGWRPGPPTGRVSEKFDADEFRSGVLSCV
jgi:hypothetical protein